MKHLKQIFFGMFFLTQAAVPHLSKGDAIVNTTSNGLSWFWSPY